MAKPISPDLVGETFNPMPASWTKKDVQLYALGVGAQPEGELEFVYEQKGPKVLPTYGVIAGMMSMGGMMGKVQINLANLLHGEQSITLHRPIPPQAKVECVGKITEVWDKGKAAVLGVEGLVQDKDGPICTTHATIFLRGAGGFGGERGPSSEGINEPPARDPDHVVTYQTRPEQAALYRLSGDPNPIHIDPNFAMMAGYKKPFLHGLCTYGFTGRAILHALCGGDPARFKSFEARFADQVYPGDDIVTKIWVTGEGEALVQAETQKGNTVLSKAKATFEPG
ncbi:MAG: MaoC/PaaZ C-terminal domain-containing protein [Pseudomonadota bacterium]|nr:MaoC/PaaZ C-terminal domain-containing protein [Pseudomonadota bacterium]HJO36117.1 MaoC/PaaZ C-terminal domain-containing protein [Gammaproteobacteria bacterium]